LRKEVSRSLLEENWVPEAMTLVEKSKGAALDIEQYFDNELTVLKYDKRLSSHKRNKRFVQLIDKV